MKAHQLAELLLQGPDVPVVYGGPDEFSLADEVEPRRVIRCDSAPRLFFPDESPQTYGVRVDVVVLR